MGDESREKLINPVLSSGSFIFQNNPYIKLNKNAISASSSVLLDLMKKRHYSPLTWRNQPLHLCPPTPLDTKDPKTKHVLDWIFLVSSLNFSFWSELEGLPTRYGVTWKSSWSSESECHTKKWEGYWSLLAALNRALENGIPITDPEFYASVENCPDELIKSVFEPASSSIEPIPLLTERIKVMRQVGKIFIEEVPGKCYLSLLEDHMKTYGNSRDSTLELLLKITQLFPCFRDEVAFEGQTVFFWKRAQILIAETWAAFYPECKGDIHPLLPAGVDDLTMFADYRVPQILHFLGVTEYSNELLQLLKERELLDYGSTIEIAIRAGSIVAVEALKQEMVRQMNLNGNGVFNVNCVLIDFFLWDLAKEVESGSPSSGLTGRDEILPCHRTRSIYY